MSKPTTPTATVTNEAMDILVAAIDAATNATLHIRFDITGDRAWFDDRMPRDLADAIIAAGWRPPAEVPDPAGAAVERTRDQMQKYSDADIRMVSVRQVINLLSPTWPDGNHTAAGRRPAHADDRVRALRLQGPRRAHR